MRLQRRITTADWRRTRYSSRRLVVGAKSGKTYSAATLSAFGEDLNHHSSTSTSNFNSFFTGKPAVAGLGHAFLMRNYRASLGKWQTADPLGYPENAPKKLRFGGKPRAQRSARRARKGPRWNQLVYCNNGVTSAVDLWGCATVDAVIVEVGKTAGTGGSTGTSEPIINANSADYALSVYLEIEICIGSGNKSSSSYMFGSYATYQTHNGQPNDSSLTPVTEAVYAHEYGHAQYLQTTYRQKYEEALTRLEGEWRNSGWDEAEVKARAFAAYKNVYQSCLVEMSNAANSPTVGWFQSSQDWSFVGLYEIKDANGRIKQYQYVWRRVE